MAKNVVQLVDVSCRVVSKSRDICKNGALPEHRDSEAITLDLQRVNSRLLGFSHQADKESELSEEEKIFAHSAYLAIRLLGSWWHGSTCSALEIEIERV